MLTPRGLSAGPAGPRTAPTPLQRTARPVAAQPFDLDCWRKRQHRGYFFMTGDERPYGCVSRRQVKELIRDSLEQDLPVKHVVDELQRTYEPFFLIPDIARARNCERDWRELLGDCVICMEDPTDTVDVAAGLVGLCAGA